MKKVLLIILLFLSVLGFISLFNLDIKTSELVYSSASQPNWIYSGASLWKFMYHYGNILPNACGITAGILLLASVLIKKKTDFFSKQAKRKIIFVFLLFFLVPGLIVQTSKVVWGRPRPVEITQFGGTFDFLTPFEPRFDRAGNKNSTNSFPSGHAANAFYMIFPFYVAKKRKALIFGSFGLVYGILMAITRVVQGGHFLSDVVTSAFIVYIIAEVLKILLLDKTIKE